MIESFDVNDVFVIGNCKITGKEYSAKYPTKGYMAWKSGTLIQEAMPDVSKEDREWLISGISPQGWKQMFAIDIVLDEVKELIPTLGNYSVSDCEQLINDDLLKIAAAILIRKIANAETTE